MSSVPPPGSPVDSASTAGPFEGHVRSVSVARTPVSASVVVGVTASSTQVAVLDPSVIRLMRIWSNPFPSARSTGKNRRGDGRRGRGRLGVTASPASSRATSTKAWVPLRSATRIFSRLSRRAKTLRSTSSMVTARPVYLEI
jgi:hypothetical protein